MISASAMPQEIAARFDVSRESQAGLQAYAEVLLKWQAKINLIGPSTALDLWWRHIADGLQLLPVMEAANPSGAATVVDLGSGGGVPGLVLAIARPHWQVHLVESNNKKAAFLREAARLTKSAVVVHSCRIEALPLAGFGHVDWITARALAPLPKLMDLAHELLKTGRGLFHKGQDVDAELTEATKYWSIEYQKHPSLIDPRSSLLEITQLRSRHGIDASRPDYPV